ncbi:MAG: hypothetical protein KGO49_12610 [Gammaproteobacteria bacterium]|nr:hypothetical protein [Gammaproteobacteria bacterium]
MSYFIAFLLVLIWLELRYLNKRSSLTTGKNVVCSEVTTWSSHQLILYRSNEVGLALTKDCIRKMIKFNDGLIHYYDPASDGNIVEFVDNIKIYGYQHRSNNDGIGNIFHESGSNPKIEFAFQLDSYDCLMSELRKIKHIEEIEHNSNYNIKNHETPIIQNDREELAFIKIDFNVAEDRQIVAINGIHLMSKEEVVKTDVYACLINQLIKAPDVYAKIVERMGFEKVEMAQWRAHYSKN